MRKTLLVLAIVSVVVLAGCDMTKNDEATRDGGKTALREQGAVAKSFERLQKSQPTPSFDYSQHRQTLIDVETIKATGATSTTAFFLEGIGMVAWCPSIGAPVASTDQLSSTKQLVDIPNDESRVLYETDQGEPTGVYVGSSTGTWTLCLDDNGKAFGQYWEGYVMSTVAVVGSYDSDLRISIDDITYEFELED